MTPNFESVPDLDVWNAAETANLEAAIQAGKETEARLFATVEGHEPKPSAPAIEWPRTEAQATAFFKQGEPASWFEQLPETMKGGWSWNLLHSYKTFLKHTQIARNLETRADELAALVALIEAQGFTIDDLEAFGRKARGQSPFRFAPNYVLPDGYKWSNEE